MKQIEQKPTLESLYEAGQQCLLNPETLDEAIQYFDKVLTIEPAHYQSLVNKGFLLLLRSDNVESDLFEAKHSFNEALKIEGSCWPLQWCLGMIYARLKLIDYAKLAFEEALMLYQQANEAQPAILMETFNCLYALEAFYRNDYDASIERAGSLNENDSSRMNTNAHLIKAQAHMVKGEYADANLCLETVIKYSPCRLDALYHQSTIFLLQGDLQRAATVLGRIELQAEKQLFQNTLSLWSAGEYKTAVVNFSGFASALLPVSIHAFKLRAVLLSTLMLTSSDNEATSESSVNNDSVDDDNDDEHTSHQSSRRTVSKVDQALLLSQSNFTYYEKVQLCFTNAAKKCHAGQANDAVKFLIQAEQIISRFSDPLIREQLQFEQCVVLHSLGFRYSSASLFRDLCEHYPHSVAIAHAALFYERALPQSTPLPVAKSPQQQRLFEDSQRIRSSMMQVESALIDEFERDIDNELEAIEGEQGILLQLECDMVKLQSEINRLDAAILQRSDEFSSPSGSACQSTSHKSIIKMKNELQAMRDSQNVLWMRYQRKKTRAGRISELCRDKRLSNHYNQLQLKIEKMMLGCKAGASALVETASVSLAHKMNPDGGVDVKRILVKAAGEVLEKMGNVPVVGTAAKILSKGLEVLSKLRRQNDFAQFADTIPIQILLKASEQFAFDLTINYQAQLLKIKKTKYETAPVASLAKFRRHVGKKIDKLKKNVLHTQPVSYVNHLAEYAALIVLNSLFQLEKPTVVTNPKAWSALWLRKVKQGYVHNKDPYSIVTFLHKLTGDAFLIYTESGEEWDIRSVYCQTGIISNNVLYGHDPAQTRRYGSRAGTTSEAQALKMRILQGSVQQQIPVSQQSGLRSPLVLSTGQLNEFKQQSTHAIGQIAELERRVVYLETKIMQLSTQSRISPEQLLQKLINICKGNIELMTMTRKDNTLCFTVHNHPARESVVNTLADDLSYLNETSRCEINDDHSTVKWSLLTKHLAKRFSSYLSISIARPASPGERHNRTHHHSSRHHRQSLTK